MPLLDAHLGGLFFICIRLLSIIFLFLRKFLMPLSIYVNTTRTNIRKSTY